MRLGLHLIIISDLIILRVSSLLLPDINYRDASWYPHPLPFCREKSYRKLFCTNYPSTTYLANKNYSLQANPCVPCGPRCHNKQSVRSPEFDSQNDWNYSLPNQRGTNALADTQCQNHLGLRRPEHEASI